MADDDLKRIERLVRRECALIAAAEYGYWKNLPDPGDPVVQAMQISAMGAASNICASIMLGRTASDHELGLLLGRE